jgi:WD40 repeat protein
MIKKTFLLLTFVVFLILDIHADKSNDKLNSIRIDMIKPNINPVILNKTNKPKDLKFQDDKNNLSWRLIGYRGFHIFDSITGKEGYLMCGDGNSKVVNVFIADEDKKIIFIDVSESGGSDYYILYDALNFREIQRIRVPSCFIFPFFGKLLVCEFIKGPQKYHWYITDLFFKNIEENELTKILTEKSILFYPKNETFSCNLKYSNICYEKNLLIGEIEEEGIPDRFIIIRWDENYKIVDQKTIIKQKAGERQYIDEVQISQDGTWLKWEEHSGVEDNKTKIFFYQINQDYYEGLSNPVYAGTFDKDYTGNFYNSKKYGSCYIINDIYLYKQDDLINSLSKTEKDNTYNKYLQDQNQEIFMNANSEFKLSSDGKKMIYKTQNGKFHYFYDINYENFNMHGKSISYEMPVLSFEISYNGMFVVISSMNNTIDIFEFDETSKVFKIIKTWQSPDKNITAIAFSNNDKFIAGGTSNGRIYLWDINGSLITNNAIHTNKIDKICFSPDDKIIASSSTDNTICFSDINGKIIQSLCLEYTSTSIGFSPSGKYFIIGGKPYNNKDKINEININGKPVKLIKDNFTQFCFSPDEKYYAAYIGLGTFLNRWGAFQINSEKHSEVISVKNINGQIINSIFGKPWLVTTSNWNETIGKWMKNGNIEKIITGTSSSVTTIAISSDDKIIATNGDGANILLWNIEGALINKFYGHTGKVNLIIFSDNSNKILSAGDDGNLILWDSQGNIIKKYGIFLDKIIGINIAGDEICGWTEKTLKIWNIQGELIYSTKDKFDRIWGIFPNGSRLIVEKNNIKFIIDRNEKKIRDVEFYYGHISFSSDNEYFTVVKYYNNEGWVWIYDYNGKLFYYNKELIEDNIKPVFIESQNKLIYSKMPYEFKLNLYNYKNKTLSQIEFIDPIYSLCAMNDGRHLICGTENGFKILNIDNNTVNNFYIIENVIDNSLDDLNKNVLQYNDITIKDEKEYKSSCISYDNKYLVMLRDNIYIFDIKSLKLLRIINLNKKYNSDNILLSTCNKFIVCYGEILEVYDFDTGNKIYSIYESFNNAVISSDSNYLTCAKSNSIKIYDLKTGSMLNAISNIKTSINHLSISKNNTYIACSSYYIYLFDFKTGELLKEIESAYNPVFSNDDKYLLYNQYEYNNGKSYYKLTFYDIKSDSINKTINTYSKNFKLSPDNNSIISCYRTDDYVNHLEARNFSTGNILWSKELNDYEIKNFNLTDKYIQTGLGGYSAVRIFDISTGNQINSFKPYENEFALSCISDDGKYLYAYMRGGVVLIYEISKKQKIVEIYTKNFHPNLLIVSKSKNYIIIDGDVYKLDGKSCTYYLLFNIYREYANNYNHALSISPDEKYIIMNDYDDYSKINLINLQTNEMIEFINPNLNKKDEIGEMKFSRFSDDGTKIITAHWGGYFFIWDFKTKTIIKAFKSKKYFNYIITSDDLKKIFISNGYYCSMIDTDTAEEHEITGPINFSAFYLSNDAKIFIFQGKSNEIFIWDTNTKEFIKKIMLEGSYRIHDLFLSADNDEIIAVYTKEIIRFISNKKF